MAARPVPRSATSASRTAGGQGRPAPPPRSPAAATSPRPIGRPGARPRRPARSGERRISGRIGVGRQHDLAVALDDPRRHTRSPPPVRPRGPAQRRPHPGPTVVTRPGDGASGRGDRGHQHVGVGVPEIGATPSWSSSSNRSWARPRALVQRDPHREQDFVGAEISSVNGGTTGVAFIAARRICTSRRPPSPSFTSGSSRNATGPVAVVALVDLVGQLREEPRRPLAPQIADAADQFVGQLRVTGDRRASINPRAARTSLPAT